MTLCPHHIELDGGTITRPPDRSAIGRRRFFVDLVEDDGAHFPLWDGEHLGDAIRQAHAARRDFGVERVVDRFHGQRK